MQDKEMTREKNNLTTGTVWKQLLIYFLPIVTGTVIQQLYNAVDGFVVGRYVGTNALAAVGGSSAMIIMLLVNFFVSMTNGAAVIIGQLYGAGRKEDLRETVGNSIAVMTTIGFALTVFGLLASPALLTLLRTPAETMADSILYLRIYFLGVPVIMALNMESSALRAVGDSMHPFVYMIAACLLNIGLDLLFVIAFHWGVAGVAIATVLAQVLNMMLLTVQMAKADTAYRFGLRDLKLKGSHTGKMMKLGIPVGLQSSMYNVSNTLIQVAVNSLGTIVVASWAMSSKIDGFFWAFTNSMGVAITNFIAQNYGAGKTDRVRACTKQGFLMDLLGTILIGAALLIFGIPLLRLLTPDENVVSTTYQIMISFVPYYAVWAAVEVLSAVLRGIGDAVKPVVIIGIGVCLFRVIWLVTVFLHFRTLFVLCLSYPISWGITAAALFIYYRRNPYIRENSGQIEA